MLLHHTQTSQLEITSLKFSGVNNTQYPIKSKSAKKLKVSSQEKPVRVLVVEDEPINQCVAKSLLEGKGYQVDIAATGQAALHCYQANQYAVILMDMGLPDLPGTEVTRHIRTLEQANGQHIPIIALTANGLGAKPECLAAGMDDFSGKPFEIDQLDQVLKAWIEKSK